MNAGAKAAGRVDGLLLLHTDKFLAAQVKSQAEELVSDVQNADSVAHMSDDFLKYGPGKFSCLARQLTRSSTLHTRSSTLHNGVLMLYLIATLLTTAFQSHTFAFEETEAMEPVTLETVQISVTG